MRKINGLVLLFTVLFFLCFENALIAQTLRTPGQQNNTEGSKDETPITNYKVVSEKKDPSTGNFIRVVSYEQGGMKITETIISPPFPSLSERKPINTDTMNMDSIMILVDKRQYLLAVLYKRKRIRQYRATFGPNRLKDKCQEGDRCTPEGLFRIVDVRNHTAWQKFMLLDYPNTESYKRFYDRKTKGEISNNATIGFGIGIHGIFAGGDEMVDMGIGWTDGCVSLKSTDIYDLSKFVRKGTRVYIVNKH